MARGLKEMDAIVVAEAGLGDQAPDNDTNHEETTDPMKPEFENRFQKAIAAWRSEWSTRPSKRQI